MVKVILAILGLIGTISGALATLYIAFKKFRLDLIAKRINDENDRRKNVAEVCANLRARHYQRALETAPVSPDEISQLCEDSRELMAISAGCSTDISNMATLLFEFINLLHHDNTDTLRREHRYQSRRTTNIYGFFIRVLDYIRSEAESSAPHPTFWQVLFSLEVKKQSKVANEFRELINPSHRTAFVFMEQGREISPFNLEAIKLMDLAMQTRDEMVMACAYRTVGPGAIERLLFAKGLYFPPSITLPIAHLLTESMVLDMIGFQIDTRLPERDTIIRFLFTPRISHQGLPIIEGPPMEDRRFFPVKDNFLNVDFDSTGGAINISINDESNVLRYVVTEDFVKALYQEREIDLRQRMADQIKKRKG